jgi:hypothetical protein
MLEPLKKWDRCEEKKEEKRSKKRRVLSLDSISCLRSRLLQQGIHNNKLLLSALQGYLRMCVWGGGMILIISYTNKYGR